MSTRLGIEYLMLQEVWESSNYHSFRQDPLSCNLTLLEFYNINT